MSGQLQRYELMRTIARGGMATVSEAIAHGADGFRRKVAVKRILPELAADESMRRMFLDEARIASELHHGNIVQIIDYGLVDDGPFLVMELVDGLSARQACSSRPPPVGVSLYMAAEIAHALAYLATAQDASGAPLEIVHRDLSPHNVLLSWEGDVKLSDFGVALARVRDEHTEAGVVKGKRAYMPPEQADGKPVTPASDVYALGATLCYFLTGAPPDEDALGDIEDDEVLALVRSCLAEAVEQRPSAGEVAERAGQLSAAKLGRDARGAMRSWLSSLEPKRSTLDDLMGVALVPDEAGGFTLSRSAASPEPQQEVRSPVRWVPLAAVALIVIALVVWWATRPPGVVAAPGTDPVEEPDAPAEESVEDPVDEPREQPRVDDPIHMDVRVEPTKQTRMGGIRIDRDIRFDDQ